MTAVLLVAAIAAGVWVAVALRRVPLLSVLVATVMVGYVLGHWFWHIRLGPLPITLDRLLLGLVLLIAAFHTWRGTITWPRPLLVDWALMVTLMCLSLSALMNNVGSDANLPTSPFFRLLFSFWIPALLYFVVRCTTISTRATTNVLAALTLLGVYLALTAVGESTGQWWAVFPKYLANPELGTHFGRARGPALNSVSLGVHLSVACWAAWQLRPRVARSWQLSILAAIGLMVFAIVLTYTRSAWVGMALSAFVVLLLETPRRVRWQVAITAVALGVVTAAIGWTYLMQLKREDSGQVSEHSVQQRAAFAYVSWQMFCDDPLWGVGFGRFYDKKLPYLSDRSQAFELESLRGLHHHNTLLSLLTETGMLGLAGYLAILAGWAAIGWRMSLAAGQSLAARQMGRLLLATLAVYFSSALFHDMSLIHQDQWLLFLIAGLAVATAEQTSATASARNSLPIFSTLHLSPRGPGYAR